MSCWYQVQVDCLRYLTGTGCQPAACRQAEACQAGTWAPMEIVLQEQPNRVTLVTIQNRV